MISRNYIWRDESTEHSDSDIMRAGALARKWSELQTQRDEVIHRRQSAFDDGFCGPEAEECDTCGGASILVPDSHPSHRNGRPKRYRCGAKNCSGYVNIKCPNPTCTDGVDMGPVIQYQALEEERLADWRLEVELVEDKLAAIGAAIR